MQEQSRHRLDQQEEFIIENTQFEYKKYKDTIFVPIYPRACVEEVIGIDADRRTVTARFVIHLTIKLQEQNKDLRKFIRNHLILQFDYNQVIYIPELMMRDNPPYIIKEVSDPNSPDDYVTYMIKGNIECSAFFDMMLFPYRQIQVINHLVIRSQFYKGKDKDYTIKYNAMMLLEGTEFHQFSPHIIYPQFAGYSIVYGSTEIFTGESKQSMQKMFKNEQILGYLGDIFINKNKKSQEKEHFSPEELAVMVLGMQKMSPIDVGDDYDRHQLKELCPFKHITFKFDMVSYKLAYVLQNEIPIWMLGVVSLYLFTSPPNIDNRYGNSILIIVSMIALLTNFRINNIQHHSISLYELKIMIVMIVPLLLIISTAVDFYSNTNFDLRSSQIENPFMLASVVIYSFFFALTVIFLIYIIVSNEMNNPGSTNKQKAEKEESEENWNNLDELRWGQPKLFRQIVDLFGNNPASLSVKARTMREIVELTHTRLNKSIQKRQGNLSHSQVNISLGFNSKTLLSEQQD